MILGGKPCGSVTCLIYGAACIASVPLYTCTECTLGLGCTLREPVLTTTHKAIVCIQSTKSSLER